MNREAVRGLFQPALDGELDPDTRAALDQALASDAELRAEFDDMLAVQRATAALGSEPVAVDLLAGVQQKLRTRSGGKFYRDRFAERSGRSVLLMWGLMSVSLLLLAVAAWFAFDSL